MSPQFYYGYQPYTQVYSSPQGTYTWTPNSPPYLVIPSHPHHSPYRVPSNSSPTTPQSVFPPAWTSAPYPPQFPAHANATQAEQWLIPNQVNQNPPQILWDLTQPPTMATRPTGKHTVIDERFEFSEDIMYPAVPKVHVRLAGSVGLVFKVWGPIVIKNERSKPLSARDILNEIYAFFQKPVSQWEIDEIKEEEKNYDTMIEAMEKRCYCEIGLPGRAWKQGMKRADVLGAYISFGDLTVIENTGDTLEFSLKVLNRTGN